MSRATELMDDIERWDDTAVGEGGGSGLRQWENWQSLRAEVERIEDELRGTNHVLSEIRNRQGKSQAVPRTMTEIEARALERAANRAGDSDIEIEAVYDDYVDVIRHTVYIDQDVERWLNKEAARLRAGLNKDK